MVGVCFNLKICLYILSVNQNRKSSGGPLTFFFREIQMDASVFRIAQPLYLTQNKGGFNIKNIEMNIM